MNLLQVYPEQPLEKPWDYREQISHKINHDHNGSGLVWRVFENGEPHLATSIKIVAPVFDEVTVENGVEKWNLCCYGYLTLENGAAVIR